MQTFSFLSLKTRAKLALGTIASFVGLMLARAPAKAIIGDTVTGDFSAPYCGTLLNQSATVVDPGTEFTANPGGTFSLDVKNDSFSFKLNFGWFGL